jgi:hypothetical protein
MHAEYREKLLGVLAHLDQIVTEADAVLRDAADTDIYARMENVREERVETRAKVEEKLERLAL